MHKNIGCSIKMFNINEVIVTCGYCHNQFSISTGGDGRPTNSKCPYCNTTEVYINYSKRGAEDETEPKPDDKRIVVDYSKLLNVSKDCVRELMLIHRESELEISNIMNSILLSLLGKAVKTNSLIINATPKDICEFIEETYNQEHNLVVYDILFMLISKGIITLCDNTIVVSGDVAETKSVCDKY